MMRSRRRRASDERPSMPAKRAGWLVILLRVVAEAGALLVRVACIMRTCCQQTAKYKVQICEENCNDVTSRPKATRCRDKRATVQVPSGRRMTGADDVVMLPLVTGR